MLLVVFDVPIPETLTESICVQSGDNGEETLETICCCCCCLPLLLVAGSCLNRFLTNALDRAVDDLSAFEVLKSIVFILLVGVELFTMIIPGCGCC